MVKPLLLTLLVCAMGGVYGAELALAMSARFRADKVPFWEIDRASPEHKKEIVALARTFGASMDTRDRIEVVNDLRSRGVDAVPAVWLGEVEAAQLRSLDHRELVTIGGISNSRTVLCNESGEYVIYDSDEHGFRNPRGVWRSSHADLAVIGESFAQGDCVPDGRSFADLLRAKYPITLNLGSSGESSLLQLAAIREYLQFYSPKVVLWVFCEGIDLTLLQRTEGPHPLLRRYLDGNFSQRLMERQLEIDTALRSYLSEAAKQESRAPVGSARSPFVDKASGILKLWDLRRWLTTTYGEGYSEEAAVLGNSNVRLFGEALSQARDMTARWGGTLYFVYLPSWDRYRNNSTGDERERRIVLNVVDSLRIPLIDVHSAFQAHGDPLSLFPFRRFGHYNEAGHRVVADAVLQALSVRNKGQATELRATDSGALARLPEPRR